jgi:predicted RNA-binding Zn-ribbon protein involved in translation (DUF1610 family)
MIMLCSVASNANASVWYSVNYDQKTVAAMVAAFGTETATELYYNEQVKKILDRYSAAEVAAAGIFAAKYLDRKALTNLNIWNSSSENYYYRRIYSMVSAKIMPKIWTVAQMMITSPKTAIYWGSYLTKICTETKALCMQFESVVTNSTLGFSDVAFLEFYPEVAQMFNLSEAGNVDWKQFLDDLGNISHNFTKENLKSDINQLYNLGVGIANAGVENALSKILKTSDFNSLMTGNIRNIAKAVSSSYDLYKSLDGVTAQKLLSWFRGKLDVSRLLKVGSYNLTSWMTDYLKETAGQYYTQRWYIYRVESGSEVLCDYTPSTEGNNIINGSEWTRIATTDAGFTPSAEETEQILSNSESYAGWSRAMVNQLNAANDGYTYEISYNRLCYTVYTSGKLDKKAYAYSINVTKNWHNEIEVFEDVFDSYSMDLNTFQRQLQAQLIELNDNEEGYEYYLGYDDKNYYSTTDEAKIQGTENVIISVTCHDGFKLTEGNTQYKCGNCGKTITAHTQECSMMTTVTESGVDTSDLDTLEQRYADQAATLQHQIDNLEAENAAIAKQIASVSMKEGAALRQQYNDNLEKIEALQSELDIVKQKQADVQAAKDEASAGEAEQTDDYYRIPAIMKDCQTAFDLNWTDAGSWSGDTFTRTATSGSMSAEIQFKATISIARKPKYFMGIKIHRAIVQISWEMTADYSDTQVVEVIELDKNKTDQENVQIVNKRISEIAQEYPSCTLSIENIKSETPEDDASTDTYHLLWSSDRLEIARQIDARITQIYADLVSLEKMMHYKRSIIDVLKDAAPTLNATQGKKLTITEEAHERWMKSAKYLGKEGGAE